MAEQQTEDANESISIKLEEQALNIHTPSIEQTNMPRTLRFGAVSAPSLLELKQTFTYDHDEKKNPNHENTVSDIEEEAIQYTPEEIKDNTSLSEYAYGVGFSYYKDWTYYPYITPKYNNLKDELLNNEIHRICLENYNQIYKRGVESHQTCKIVA
eukprot:427585_1